MPTSFIESGFTTKTEYDAWIASGGASTGGGGALTLGYWKIRGLAAACRMMLYAKKQPYHEVAYGEDAKEQWFGGDKVCASGRERKPLHRRVPPSVGSSRRTRSPIEGPDFASRSNSRRSWRRTRSPTCRTFWMART